jgi:predicted nucleic acid-binding protein
MNMSPNYLTRDMSSLKARDVRRPVNTRLTTGEILAGSRAKAEAAAEARSAARRGRVVRVDKETIEREARVREQCRTLPMSASYLGYP